MNHTGLRINDDSMCFNVAHWKFLIWHQGEITRHNYFTAFVDVVVGAARSKFSSLVVYYHFSVFVVALHSSLQYF